jgi:hypothetical protein
MKKAPKAKAIPPPGIKRIVKAIQEAARRLAALRLERSKKQA